jgi:CRP-like cAMP-binding protein
MATIELHAVLSDCELFKGLDADAIESISAICEKCRYRAGEEVYQQGQPGEHLYIVIDGKVALERTVTIGAREGRVIIDTLGRGRVFGCWSTLLDKPHTMMLRTYCQTPTTILRFRGTELRRLMLEAHQFGFDIIERLCLLLRERIQSAYGAMEKI